MTVKKILRNKLIDYNLISNSNSGLVCPVLYTTTIASRDILNSILTFQGDSRITPGSKTSFSFVINEFNKLKTLSLALADSASELLNNYKLIIDKCTVLYKRIGNEKNNIDEIIDKLLEYSCVSISTDYSNQTENSYIGKIGKYVTLPYFMDSVIMYDGEATYTLNSPDTIKFENLTYINSIPLKEDISFKVLSSNEIVTFTLSINIESTSANGIYFKFSNKVKTLKLTLYDNTNITYSAEYNTNEVFANFEQKDFNNIVLQVAISNPNADKPVSIQLDEIHIFKHIQFAKFGVFECKPKYLNDFGDFSKISVTHSNLGDTTNTNVEQQLSISSTETNTAYNSIDKDIYADISVYKYKNKYNLISNNISGYTKNTSEANIDGTNFITRQIIASDALWDMDYMKALIIYGINTEYCNPTYYAGDTDPNYEDYKALRYDNWTFNNNYYKTSLLNWEDDVYLNIGGKKIILNGKERTGNIKIPVGFSTIEVHMKDINFGVNIFDKTSILEDPLYPYNFLYMLSGMPEYGTNDSVLSKATKTFQIKESNIFALGESFIPFSEVVIDNSGRQYEFQLTKAVTIPGTYTLEPFSGRIKVCPYERATSITIEYRRATYNRRPIGILFNRLLTYAPLNSIVNKASVDNTLFSFDGQVSAKRLIMPYLDSNRAVFSQVIYNTSDFSLYSSVKLELESVNKYLTPIVSGIFLMVE